MSKAAGIEVQPLAPCDSNLPLDEVDAGHHLGNRVLDLQSRVHLEEIEPAVVRQEELDGPGARVAHRARNRRGGRRHGLPQLRRDSDRRRLLDDFLMAPLDRALAFDERQHRSVLVAKDLHLDVPRPRQPSLEVDRGVAECRSRFRARGTHGAGEVRRIENRAHALAAAARHGLDEHGISDACGERLGRPLRRPPATGRSVPGTTGTPALRAAARAAVLLPISAIASGDRADERQAGVAHGRGERFVLGEEPVPRVDGVGARSSPLDINAIDSQVAVARRAPADLIRLVGVSHVQRSPIALGVDGDRRVPSPGTHGQSGRRFRRGWR